MVLDQLRVNRLWEAVCQTSHELVTEIDPTGVVQFINGAALELLGVAPADLVGRSVFTIIHPDDIDEVRRVFADCVARRVGWDAIRVRARRPDGAAPWMETSGIAHVDDDGRLLGFTSTSRPLSADDARRAEMSKVRERIEEVLAGRLLRTLWQPIFSLGHGSAVGAEALTRFTRSPQQSPDRWFREAYDVGLGVELELLALEAALVSARELPKNMYLSLNVSPGALGSARFGEVIENAPFTADRIVLELTEHASVEDYESLASPLDRLRGAGVRLAVDDAGAGFASFRHILRLNPDMIKIDQSITQGITDNPAQRALATALVLFSLEIGHINLVAEGVETAEDLATVAALGLDGAQGFHVSRPLPPADVDWGAVIPQPCGA